MSQFGDKFQPVESTSPSEIEALRLKRAMADVYVLDWDGKESLFDAILEYRGRTLILTRTKGEFSAQWVVEGLETDYFKRYAVEDMLLVVTILEHGKVAHATVKNPDEFLQYLHLLKNLRSVDIRNIESRWLKTVSRRPTVGV